MTTSLGQRAPHPPPPSHPITNPPQPGSSKTAEAASLNPPEEAPAEESDGTSVDDPNIATEDHSDGPPAANPPHVAAVDTPDIAPIRLSDDGVQSPSHNVGAIEQHSDTMAKDPSCNDDPPTSSSDMQISDGASVMN